jgi:hypothetical protein
MLTLIKLTQRAEPFDHTDWVFEAKFDGFRAAADTVRARPVQGESYQGCEHGCGYVADPSGRDTGLFRQRIRWLARH